MPEVPRNTPKPRGWRGSSSDFKVTGQQYGRKSRISQVDDTYDYPGVDNDSEEEY